MGQFALNIRRRADRVAAGVNAVKKAVARAVAFFIIDDTPVDTGEARSNWIASLGLPVSGTIAPYRPYPKGSQAFGRGVTETANASAAKQRAAGVIAAAQPGQTIIVQNNVEHINLLNDGSSGQAPALFVQDAVKVGIRSLNDKTVTVVGP